MLPRGDGDGILSSASLLAALFRGDGDGFLAELGGLLPAKDGDLVLAWLGRGLSPAAQPPFTTVSFFMLLLLTLLKVGPNGN